MDSQLDQEKIDLSKIDWVPFLLKMDRFSNCVNENVKSSAHRTCPICGGAKSFRFTNYRSEGDWICKHCGAGKGPRLLKESLGISYLEVMQLLVGENVQLRSRDVILREQSEEFSEQDIAKNKSKLCRAYRESRWMKRTDYAWKYLSKRIPYLDFDRLDRSVRFHPSMPLGEENENRDYVVRGRFPTLLALVTDDKSFVTMHRHFVTKDGKKAPFENSKQQMSGLRKLNGDHVCVVKNPNSRTLAVGEGYETMCAAAVAHSYSINVRSYLNEGNLRKAKISRAEFDHVIIYADHDKLNQRTQCKTGEKAAGVLAQRLMEMGFSVEIRIPPVEETDWLDVWFAACLKIPNLPAKLLTLCLQKNSDNPFGIIAELMDPFN